MKHSYQLDFERNQAERWRRSNSQFVESVAVGDEVMFSVYFLQNTGQVASNNPRVHSKGRVTEKRSAGMVMVRWDCDGPDAEPVLVSASNLGHPFTSRTSNIGI